MDVGILNHCLLCRIYEHPIHQIPTLTELFENSWRKLRGLSLLRIKPGDAASLEKNITYAITDMGLTTGFCQTNPRNSISDRIYDCPVVPEKGKELNKET
ncbi:unnamed protein product [Nezara viridula]|uniref:Uncharacterized protein n=1 Tax=Nezara viridula TaxID=85310 RepID=A0A9P0MWV7_NEZVI|nr:unnamed protein product [Nezara viridula]